MARLVLGIETSCDETAAAVVADGRDIRANVISSQVALHRPYGGVVPELASREHLANLPTVIKRALAESGCALAQIDAVAATYGPGLASSLLIGLNAARGIALAAGKPFVPVNHLEAHLYSPLIGASAAEEMFPLVALVVSGGHTMIIHATDLGAHRILGQTLDDAAGEAFDKVAKLLGLGYPGGPAIECCAASGDPAAVSFPRSMLDDPSDNFSFSGLKTAALYHLRDHPETAAADVAASFQEAVVDVLVGKLVRAAARLGVRNVAAAGGVSLNQRLRQRLTAACEEHGWQLRLASPSLCTDNAAMIAALAYHQLQRGFPANESSHWEMDVDPSCGLGRSVN